MNFLRPIRRFLIALSLAISSAGAAFADVSDLLFTVRIDGNANTPTIYVTNNSPQLEITRFKLTIGDTAKHFDHGHALSIQHPPGGSVVWLPPASSRSDAVEFSINGFGPGETFSFSVDLDRDATPDDPTENSVENYANVFYNNGANVPNAVATVWSGPVTATRELTDNPKTPVFRGPGRTLRIVSASESGSVKKVKVTIEGEVYANAAGEELIEDELIVVSHGDRILITAPEEAYKDIHGLFISDSNAADLAAKIEQEAEEKLVAKGMSVNNVPETGDPTRYDFEITGNTDVKVNWDQYYALTVRHDFSKTQSLETVAGKPWVGPLASDAAGNPDPPVSKHWVLRGTQPVVKVDGQFIDNFSHPGLDIRHVVTGYRAYGPPNRDVTQHINSVRFASGADPGVDIRAIDQGTVSTYAASGGVTRVTTSAPHKLATGNLVEIVNSGHPGYNAVHSVTVVDATNFTIPVAPAPSVPVAKGTWRNVTFVKFFPFATVEQRQQLKPSFSMYGPGGVTYVWQVQYGIRVNADDPSRTPLARVYEIVNGQPVDRTVQNGPVWFDPGARVKVMAAVKEEGADGLSLTGWANGDGYYFAGQGQIDTSNGDLVSGTPANGPNGSPVAQWSKTPVGMLGFEIPNLQRPGKVFWRYGTGAIAINVVIGQHLFENHPEYAEVFVRAPEPVSEAQPDAIATPPAGAAPGPPLMAEWDPANARLYPTLPGTFTVPWKPGLTANNPIEIRVTATLPFDADRGIRGHYPHIHGTPPVALDPDPNDEMTFKSIKHSTAGAAVDGSGRFTTQNTGLTVLLFSQIQSVGRGQPREFLAVRVVDTRAWDAGLPATPAAAEIGRKILDPGVDRANLGTGFVMNPSGRARYNPFIYDAGKLDGLAARNIYDMEKLRADSSSLEVLDKTRLPGPVIPVNLQPNAPVSELPRVVWYDDPRRNDTLMWPLAARVYRPVWPSENDMPRIVIASQFGSESKSADNKDQEIAPAIGDFPAATTFDPSRLQAVTVYQQPDPDAAGYNPNEEHALLAPSLRFAAVSPRPPAVYALRAGDLNQSNPAAAGYTSHPYVLVQFSDVADGETKMKVFKIRRETATGDVPQYKFATNFSANTSTLKNQPFVTMRAGEPVIPFYPLGVAIGAAPPPEIFGSNFFAQETYWEDWRGSYWSISGGDRAWFHVSFYYPLAPDFWWPATRQVPPVKVVKSGASYTPQYDTDRQPRVPGTGDAVAFLPADVAAAPTAGNLQSHLPTRVIFKSEWPENPPVLKAGETLTFSGGEYRADNPTRTIVRDGQPQTVETPGLPQLTAFASAEVVFDSLNPEARPENLPTKWTARVVQALDRRTAPLPVGSFPSELQPASGRTTVRQGKYTFNELPASLQRRVRYDPLALRVDSTGAQVPGALEIIGLLNDKEIGDPSLTAAPPAVYVLEPNILTDAERQAMLDLVEADNQAWEDAVDALYDASRNPEAITTAGSEEYLVGLMRTPQFNPDGSIRKNEIGDILYATPETPRQLRAFGPGLALVPNGDFLDPNGMIDANTPYPDESWVTVVENNDASMGGSPITPHIIKVDRTQRYRGAIKTVLSDNVFDENIVLRSTGDFGANADDLVFEWWYRPDDGSLNVPPPDLIPPGQTNPWKLFPDPSGEAGKGRFQMTLKGNPNAPEALLADTWWFLRYRHVNDNASGTNWKLQQPNGRNGVNFTWAGAGNSDPFRDLDLDGFPDFRAQLAQGWIKRVLDAVNPYEARIRDFEGDSPSTLASMIAQFGQRYEGPVALNPDKNVIENVGLIELYETILDRGRKLSIDLSRPVSTPAIANALQLASTRISDFYTLLGNEAYADALDPTIGHGSNSVEYGSFAPAVFSFQNQMSSLLEEELALLRGVDDFFARPVYNRLFWNFTKGEGEAAYANTYNVSDINQDGFIDEDDAMQLFPQGHGDAWGHYLTAVRNQYDLLRHPYFNWVSRSESYNLQDIVITVDFLDERKFAAAAAAKAKAGAEIVSLTYRDRFVADANAQWQGYTDSNPDRAWGVDEWARRAGQGAYFDWVTANALLPSEHPNTTLEGIRKVDRKTNSDIAVVSANLNAIQSTIDQSDKGYNPLGLARGAQMFDLDPSFLEIGTSVDLGTRGVQGALHFDQIFERANKAIENTAAIWDNANKTTNMLRQVGNSEAEFRNATFQEDLSYRNRLIEIFGKPYEGTIGPGKLYPAGYEGPDLALYMYVPVRQINKDTVPGPSAGFAAFDASGTMTGGDLWDAFNAGPNSGSGSTVLNKENALQDVDEAVRSLFSATFSHATSNLTYAADTKTGLFAVNYTDLTDPKVELENFVNQMPVTAAGYTFQAPKAWGGRKATGELQKVINEMIQQEADLARAIGAWDALSGESVRILRLVNAKLTTSGLNQGRDEIFGRVKYSVEETIKTIETAREVIKAARELTWELKEATVEGVPLVLPTGGVAVSPGDALSLARSGIEFTAVGTRAGFLTADSAMAIGKRIAEITLAVAEKEVEFAKANEDRKLQIKEWLKELEDKVGDEPVLRIAIFKEMEALRALSDRYRTLLDQGGRLLDERAAFNKRVAAQTQKNRYQDMTFRVSRNHALTLYRQSFDLAAKYAWLAAAAYDYETNYAPADPGSAQDAYGQIVRARSLNTGLTAALNRLKTNYDSQRGQLGFNNVQREMSEVSLRRSLFRVLPSGEAQPDPQTAANEFPAPGQDSDAVWRAELQKARVDNLWELPEFRYYCRPFAAAQDAQGNPVPQPGLVLRFSSDISSGKNFFGKPLGGGDHSFSTSNFATKIIGVGVSFDGYQTDNVLTDLAAAPRVYLIPAGMDVMRVSRTDDPEMVRTWKVVHQAIPVPLPATGSQLDRSGYIPLLDSVNGSLGAQRKFSDFRAYPAGDVDPVTDTRLVGRSIWNTQWVLVIPGVTLNANPNVGLERFVEQVSDILLTFDTYGQGGG